MRLRRLLSAVICLLDVGSATRHTAFLEQKAKVELVPALLSRAVRVAMKESRTAVARAESLEAAASAMRKEAMQKQETAKKRSQEIDDLLNQTQQKEQRLLAQQKEVSTLMASHNESQEKWRTENEELEKMQENLTEENRLYEELKKNVEQEIANLTDKQHQAYQRLGELQDALNEKQEDVLQLREEAENHGHIARNASRAADDVQANLVEAQDLWNKQKISAEEAEQDFLHAKMHADAAERTHMDSAREVAKAVAVKDLVLAARNALQRYYDLTDKLTNSMEERLSEDVAGKAAWEVLREDPNAKLAALGYNEMTAAFRRLYMKSKDMYMFVAGSIPEIRENAEAAMILQCDPDGILEEEARRSGNITSLAEKCGPGLWRALGIERENFPSHDATISEDLDRELLPDENEGADEMIVPSQQIASAITPVKSIGDSQAKGPAAPKSLLPDLEEDAV